MNMVPYASAVGSLMSVQVQVRTYPDVVYVSRIFWQKSSPDIDHWNGVENVLQFCKVSVDVLPPIACHGSTRDSIVRASAYAELDS